MYLHVRHQLSYSYSEAVVLQPHFLYLQPKPSPHQRIDSYRLTILPTPTKIVKNIDTQENFEQIVYFKNSTQQLDIQSEITIESVAYNFFDFILFPFECQTLPFSYPAAAAAYLKPYLNCQISPKIEEFARQIAVKAQWKTVEFLTELAHHINHKFTYIRREEGFAHQPDQTLESNQGSCRDFALLFMTACRSIGLAARFVSGYLFGNPSQAHELHAWAEVYLPGAGWRGFDPTEGKVVTQNHLTLATSADPNSVSPVTGIFDYSYPVTSILQTQITLTEK
jgi:transglutaminase-like putative cysteine protease